MRLTCPACGATHSLQSLLADTRARESVATALALPAVLSERVLRYLGLFRPPQRALSWVIAAKRLNELNADIAAGQIKRHGRVCPAPLDYWMQALDTMLNERPNLNLPIKSHGYLYTIIADIGSRVEARAEEAEEARRRRPRDSQPQSAAALAQNEISRAKIPLNESHLTTPDGARIDTDAGEILTETRPTRVPPPEQFRALAERLKGKQETGETT